MRRRRESLRRHLSATAFADAPNILHVVFHALDEKNIGSIAKIQLATLEQRLARMDMAMDVSAEALQKIAEAGFDPVYGARPLKRAIQQQIENPLSRAILEGRFGPKDVINVSVENGELAFVKAS